MISEENKILVNQEPNKDDSSDDEEVENDFCVICFENKPPSDMYVSRCQHKWCLGCHNKLKQFGKNETCVICRQPLKKKQKKRHKKQLPYIYNEIHDEIEYEPTIAFGYTRPWRIKRRLRREMRSLLAQIKLRR